MLRFDCFIFVNGSGFVFDIWKKVHLGRWPLFECVFEFGTFPSGIRNKNGYCVCVYWKVFQTDVESIFFIVNNSRQRLGFSLLLKIGVRWCFLDLQMSILVFNHCQVSWVSSMTWIFWISDVYFIFHVYLQTCGNKHLWFGNIHHLLKKKHLEKSTNTYCY